VLRVHSSGKPAVLQLSGCLASTPPASRRCFNSAGGPFQLRWQASTSEPRPGFRRFPRQAAGLHQSPVLPRNPGQQADRALQRPWAPISSRLTTEVAAGLRRDPHIRSSEEGASAWIVLGKWRGSLQGIEQTGVVSARKHADTPLVELSCPSERQRRGTEPGWPGSDPPATFNSDRDRSLRGNRALGVFPRPPWCR